MSAETRSPSTSESPQKVMGLEKVIAFYGAYPELESQTFTRGGDWKYWQARGGIVSEGVVHYNFLRKNVDEASDVLVQIDFADNPNPVINIDEFGWDYDGGIDQHTAAVLQAVHEKRPDLKITVWQMRGPVAPELAAVYQQTVELVLLETYFDLNDAWMIPFQLQAARLTGLLDKSVVALGLGKESKDKGDHRWTQTAEELEQQIHLIRFVAPESPGVGFFGKWKLKENNCPLTDEQLDELCGRFLETPTDGSGLTPELLELGRVFTKRYEKPAIFCSSEFALPHFHSGHDGGPWGSMREPPTVRLLMMNLGQEDAKGVKARLRSPGDEGEVWASGQADIPARSVAVASAETYCRASNTMAGLAPRFWRLKRRDPRCSFSRILVSTKDRGTTPPSCVRRLHRRRVEWISKNTSDRRAVGVGSALVPSRRRTPTFRATARRNL